jgi:hypothetical protein
MLAFADLQRGGKPNIYSRQWTIGTGQLFKGQSSESSIPVAELWFENSVSKPTGLAAAIVNLCKFSLGPSWDRHLQGIAVRVEKKCREKRHNPARPLGKASTMWRSPPTSNTLEVGELSVVRTEQLPVDFLSITGFYQICLSACRDRQSAYDDSERGVTFTKVSYFCGMYLLTN